MEALACTFQEGFCVQPAPWMPGDGCASASSSASSPLASNCCALRGQICTEQETVQPKTVEEMKREESRMMTPLGGKLDPWDLCAGVRVGVGPCLNQAPSLHGVWQAPASQPSGQGRQDWPQSLDESATPKTHWLREERGLLAFRPLPLSGC